MDNKQATCSVIVIIAPEWQGNYGYAFDETLVIVASEYRNREQYYQVLGRSGACWISAEQLRLANAAADGQ